jgi:hypothetical protein
MSSTLKDSPRSHDMLWSRFTSSPLKQWSANVKRCSRCLEQTGTSCLLTTRSFQEIEHNEVAECRHHQCEIQEFLDRLGLQQHISIYRFDIGLKDSYFHLTRKILRSPHLLSLLVASQAWALRTLNSILEWDGLLLLEKSKSKPNIIHLACLNVLAYSSQQSAQILSILDTVTDNLKK